VSRRAVILAGGRGTRLKPYTVALPKPLMPIGDYPILEVIVRQLRLNKFDHITLAVNHQADIIKAYFGDGSRWGLKIDYSLETTPLGTMGPLRGISDLPEDFLVMNGDILTDIDYASIFLAHQKNKSLFTICSNIRTHAVDFGVLDVSSENYLVGFQEKPTVKYQVSMGIYVANRRVLDYIPSDSPFGFDELMHRLTSREIPVRVSPFEGYWLDIGRPDDYLTAIEQFDENRSRFFCD
jgi:NDP-mannose synthase